MLYIVFLDMVAVCEYARRKIKINVLIELMFNFPIDGQFFKSKIYEFHN